MRIFTDVARRCEAAAAIALVLALPACGGAVATPGSTQDGGGATSTPPVVSASPSQVSAGGGETGALCAVGHEPCPIEPGTYTADPFEQSFSFTIEEPWTNDRAYADGGGISQEMGGIYWASGTTQGTVGEEEVEIGGTVDDFVMFLQSLEATGMTVSEATEATIAGAPGQQVDVESNEVQAPGLFFLEEDTFNLVPDEKARFLIVDQAGETVVFIIDAFAATDFDAWLSTAQPVLDSITWN